ncbi:hypothetical protein QG37_03048 [Candidozyma auris]|nr:hypothetical protein QG37_03048 [[Candida] auris]
MLIYTPDRLQKFETTFLGDLTACNAKSTGDVAVLDTVWDHLLIKCRRLFLAHVFMAVNNQGPGQVSIIRYIIGMPCMKHRFGNLG